MMETSILDFHQRFYIPEIQKFSLNLPHIHILGTHHCGNTRQEEFNPYEILRATLVEVSQEARLRQRQQDPHVVTDHGGVREYGRWATSMWMEDPSGAVGWQGIDGRKRRGE